MNDEIGIGTTITASRSATAVLRSGSLGALYSNEQTNNDKGTTNYEKSNVSGGSDGTITSKSYITIFGKSSRSSSQPKLPSLLVAPKITASLDNCK